MLDSLLPLLAATLAVFIGNLIGRVVPLLNRVALPGAILGGLLLLTLGPQVISPGFWPLVPSAWIETFYERITELPSLFINVVFACLMLGRRFDAIPVVWQRARRMIVMGHIFAWGQYVVGLFLVVAILHPFLNVNPLAGVLIAIGFQGGHGTASGLARNFELLEFADGESYALSIATVGVVVGVLGGPLLANLLRGRSGKHDLDDDDSEPPDATSEEPAAPQRLQPNPLTGRLTVHLGLIAVVMGIGWLLLQGIQRLEQTVRPEDSTLVSNFLPLFSVVLMSGMALQYLLQRLGWDVLFDRELFEKIGAFALDMVILGALSTLALDVIVENWLALMVLGLGGLGWNLFVLLVIGPRIYRTPWYAYGVGDFGGGTATTATGIMLIRVADPDNRTGALNAYADKQPFYEPIMGGGLVTAMALPTVAAVGPWGAMTIAATILAGWSIMAWRLARE